MTIESQNGLGCKTLNLIQFQLSHGLFAPAPDQAALGPSQDWDSLLQPVP